MAGSVVPEEIIINSGGDYDNNDADHNNNDNHNNNDRHTNRNHNNNPVNNHINIIRRPLRCRRVRFMPAPPNTTNTHKSIFRGIL